MLMGEESAAQSGEWTWMHGSDNTGSPGTFGTMGISDPLNDPPAEYEPCEWTDHDGNFWLFGGFNENFLFKFDIATSSWTWMNGSSLGGQYGSYGVQGIPSASNHPGARQATATWVDDDNNLWLFGGYGQGATGLSGGLNDLWKYDITTNEWTWMSGSTLTGTIGFYGTQGAPDPANVPPARLETAATWTDSSNNLWFFGGQLCCTVNGYIDDVWKYNIATNEWTWMKGSNVYGASPVHGIKGIPDAQNTPGARRVYAHWKRENQFWLFGGQDYVQGCFNDLWEYDIPSNNWTWMKGSSVSNSAGSFGTSCVFDSLNEPPARMENRFCWTDSCNNFWMFGGINTNTGNYFNDLWCYHPLTNEWKWMSGSANGNQLGHYGTMGIPNAANHPGSRYGGVGWMGPDESIWLFGGMGFPGNNNVGALNDLWRFIPDSACEYCNMVNLPVSSFQSSDSSICEKFCVDFFDASNNNPTSWEWEFPGGNPASSSDQNPSQVCYNNPGIYDVLLITANAYGSDTLVLTNYITVNPTPPLPVITQNGNTLTATASAAYQWQFNNADIPGATNQSYTVLQSGYYTVYISDANGCSASSTVYILLTEVDADARDVNVLIYPNPASEFIMITISDFPLAASLRIAIQNVLGQIVFSLSEKMESSTFSKNIQVSSLPAGVYFLQLKMGNESMKKKLIIVKQ